MTTNNGTACKINNKKRQFNYENKKNGINLRNGKYIDPTSSGEDYDDYDEDLANLFNNMPKKQKTNKKKVLVNCPNPLCDHLNVTGESKIWDVPTLEAIKSLSDLISLGKSYHCKQHTTYSGLNLRLLCNLVEPLVELNDMVGMKSVKVALINQIVFFVQGFNKKTSCGKCIDCTYKLPCAKGQDDMLHTVITGSPGLGKTQLGKILGKIYCKLGILETDKVHVVSRSDLIGKYLGHTADKTQNEINKAKGGVLFIDEAYSLGDAEQRDSFSKECIDTLNQNLSEKRDFLCIIAGYKKELDKCFFAANPGLKRRFAFTYDIMPYDANNLKDIFLLKVNKDGWNIEQNKVEELLKLFQDNLDAMPNYGGDVETLFLNCKIVHSNRVIFSPSECKKIITMEDVDCGFKLFEDSGRTKKAFIDIPETNIWSN